MCLECCAILTNDSMKKVKMEHHQKSKHPSFAGKDRELFENKKKGQPVKLFDFVKKNMTTAKSKTLKPSYFASEIIANVGAPPVYGHHHVVSSNYLLPSLCACLSCIVEL